MSGRKKRKISKNPRSPFLAAMIYSKKWTLYDNIGRVTYITYCPIKLWEWKGNLIYPLFLPLLAIARGIKQSCPMKTGKYIHSSWWWLKTQKFQWNGQHQNLIIDLAGTREMRMR